MFCLVRVPNLRNNMFPKSPFGSHLFCFFISQNYQYGRNFFTISDHLAVISEIDCCKTKWNKEKISFRKINKFDYESFHSDIFSSDLIKKPVKDLSALCQQYDSVVSSILDKHAPVSTKTLPRKPPTPWMTPEIMKAKTLRHNLERTWRRSRRHLDRSRCKQQCHLCNRMLTKTKSELLADVISENSDNPRRLWNSINNILH